MDEFQDIDVIGNWSYHTQKLSLTNNILCRIYMAVYDLPTTVTSISFACATPFTHHLYTYIAGPMVSTKDGSLVFIDSAHGDLYLLGNSTNLNASRRIYEKRDALSLPMHVTINNNSDDIYMLNMMFKPYPPFFSFAVVKILNGHQIRT